MKDTKKTSAGLSGIHRLKTLSSIGKGSLPPSVKSAFLDLYMRQSAKDRLLQEKNRLVKEKKRLQEKEKQINQNLAEINKRMDELFKLATKTSKGLSKIAEAKSKNHTVLEY